MSLFDDEDLSDEVAEKEAAITAPAVPEPRSNPGILSHHAAESQILAWWQAGSMPHTLVLTGPQGVGKATLAFRIARFLLANAAPGADSGQDALFGPAPAPGNVPQNLDVPATHPVFAQVASGGHPDLMDIKRTVNEKTNNLHAEILVDEVREVPLFLRKTASESGGWRVVIIDEAETLNRSAQNALLKILEEPPPRALLILVTQTIGALIPTIRSRARVMPLHAPDAQLFDKLMRLYRPDLSAGDIETLAAVAGNAPGRALALLEQGGMAAIRGTLGMLDTLAGADDKTLWTMAEKLAVKSTPDPLAGMLDLSVWALQDRARQAAGRNATGAMKTALQTLDSLERHRAMCENGNLDRRHTALGALRILQQGMKAA